MANTTTTEVVGHRHIRAGACSGCRAALGFDDCDHCFISTIRNGYRTTYHAYCIDCAVRLGIVPDAHRCELN